MKIKNIVGTTGKTCACDSWLSHWEKFSGKTAGPCGVLNCNEKATVGAHVRRVDGYDYSAYIYPLCAGCNQATWELTAWDGYPLVSADPSKTCER
jgi:hypothetical protein